MGTDSLMLLLKSDINGLSTNNALVTECIYADLDNWYDFACDTIAHHATETDAQVMSSIVAQVRMNGDIAFWRQVCEDPIFTKDGFTKVGLRILMDIYVLRTREIIDIRTKRSVVQQRRKRMRLLIPPSVQQQIVGGLMSLVSLMEVVL